MKKFPGAFQILASGAFKTVRSWRAPRASGSSVACGSPVPLGPRRPSSALRSTASSWWSFVIPDTTKYGVLASSGGILHIQAFAYGGNLQEDLSIGNSCQSPERELLADVHNWDEE